MRLKLSLIIIGVVFVSSQDCTNKYLQCGGLNFQGVNTCCDGLQCEYVNDYWWQCNPVSVDDSTQSPPPETNKTNECYKVRRNIMSMNQTEIDHVIQAFHILKLRGTYDEITKYHADLKTFNLFHGNNFFLPWHRWYIIYIEDAIRNLGGRFSCFSMPYWDWVLDANKENVSTIWNIFGPLGNATNGYCMDNGPWVDWKTTDDKKSCLTRVGNIQFPFYNNTQVAELILNSSDYNSTFRPMFEVGSHAHVHLYVGGSVNTKPAPDDPLFWLHHTFVDKIFAMWQDCNSYTSSEYITEQQFLSTELDSILTYSNKTTRDIWSIKENNYTYVVDEFSSSDLFASCKWSSFIYAN